jgi:uncharacterized membrane protein
MRLKEAFKAGIITLLPMVLIGWIIYTVLKFNNAIWSKMAMPEIVTSFRLPINLTMSLFIILIMGYVVILIHPIKRLEKMFPFLSVLKIKAKGNNNKEWPVVRIIWGGAKFMCWLDEIRLDEDGEIEYKVTLPSAPLPLSGQIISVGIDKIEFSNLTTPDYVRQLGTFGFVKLPENTRFVLGTKFPEEALNLSKPPCITVLVPDNI